MRVLSIWYGGPSSSAMCGGGEFSIAVSPTRNVEGGQLMFFLFATVDANKKPPESQGLIVIRYYLALRGAENGVTAMVTPFFCVQG